MFRY